MKKTKPAVFVFDEVYEILIPSETKSLLHIECGGRKYYDAINGVLRSDTEVHHVKIPKEVLDKAGEYTVVERNVIDRRPYFPLSDDGQERPIPSDLPKEGDALLTASRILTE